MVNPAPGYAKKPEHRVDLLPETRRVRESAPTHIKKVHSAVPVATRRGQHGRRGTYAGARGHRTDGRRPISVARLSGV